MYPKKTLIQASHKNHPLPSPQPSPHSYHSHNSHKSNNSSQMSHDKDSVDLNVFYFSPQNHVPIGVPSRQEHQEGSESPSFEIPDASALSLEKQQSQEEPQPAQLTPKLTCQQKCKLNRQKLAKEWSTAHENFLKQEVPRHKNDWKKISKSFTKNFHLNGSPFFLRSQYYKAQQQQDKPESQGFGHADDIKIVQLIQLYDLDWIKIAAEMDIENPMRIKNRYYAHIKRKNRLESIQKELSEPKNSENPINKNDVNFESNQQILLKKEESNKIGFSPDPQIQNMDFFVSENGNDGLSDASKIFEQLEFSTGFN